MNNLFKKTVAGLTVGVVTLYTLPVYAFASTESVYSKLKADGESYQTIVTTKDNEEIKQEKVEKELPVETKISYTLDGKEITEFPVTKDLKRCKPVYRTFKGWKCDIRGIRKFEDLPREAQDYVNFIESQIGYPITMVSNGPGRDDIIYRRGVV